MKHANTLYLATLAAVVWFGGASANAQTLAASGGMQGMNWPNPKDNAVGPNGDGLAYPDGMTGNENYEQAYAKGQAVGNAVRKAGGWTVRMPITPQLAAGQPWWRYAGAINGAASTGCNVILCYWSPSGNKVNDLNAWYGMWDSVNTSFGNNSYIRYEPINEPAGYNDTDLVNLYAAFVSRYKPADWKCILDGDGYAGNVNPIGKDSRLSRQMLALHSYSWFWGAPNWQGFYNDMANAAGAYAWRTVVTEVGVQTDGRSVPFWQQWDFNMAPDQGVLSGTLAWARDNNVATIQWAGVNSQDLYHWFYGYGNFVEPNPQVCNMFRWAWKEMGSAPTGTRRLLNRADGKYLDSMGRNQNGGQVAQYASSTSNNQKWNIVQQDSVWFKLQNVTTGLYLDNLGNTANGSPCDMWAGSSSWNQQWALEATDSGYYKLINRATGNCVDTGGQTGNGAGMQNWSSGGSYNQQWLIQ